MLGMLEVGLDILLAYSKLGIGHWAWGIGHGALGPFKWGQGDNLRKFCCFSLTQNSKLKT